MLNPASNPALRSVATPTAAGNTVTPVRVLVVDDDDAVRTALVRQLTRAGHVVVGEASSAAEASHASAALSPDVVLLDVRMPDGAGTGAGTGAATRITATDDAGWAPAVVLCTGDVEGLRDGVVEESGAVAILAKPVSLALLDCTVRLAAARAPEFAALRADCVDVRRQLAERKLIERAKGILMRRTGTSEQEAYRILQRSSQDKATPMAVLAQAVLDSEPGAARSS